MAYIGRGVDKISNVEKLDNITFSGTTTYALTKNSAAYTPVGANNILVAIDGVVQQGNFSVSGNNIVFFFFPTNSNVCNWILLYGTGVALPPSDDSVSTAKIQSNAVTAAKIASVNISALDIDGGTDIGAAIVDADLFVVDDGAGGTNRKVTATRLKTYAQSGLTSDSIIDADSNTKIQVEEGSDENIIRFDTAGTERATIGATGKFALTTNGMGIINNATVTPSFSLASGENMMLVGPVSFSGTVTVDSGATMTVI
jgi:hypothetical protein